MKSEILLKVDGVSKFIIVAAVVLIETENMTQIIFRDSIAFDSASAFQLRIPDSRRNGPSPIQVYIIKITTVMIPAVFVKAVRNVIDIHLI